MTNEEIIQFWGEESLLRWQPQAVVATALPEDVRHFLTQVGLPRGLDWSIDFNTDAGDLNELQGYPGYYVIGSDMGPEWMCVDATRSSRVVSISIDPRSQAASIQFVNSNVHLLAEFLVLYQKYRLTVEGLDEKRARSLVDETRRQMVARDPVALTVSNSFWTSMIEEMYIGWM